MAHEIRLDQARNRIYLKLTGLSSDDDARDAVTKIIGEFGKLRPGFGCVTDISTYRPLTQEGVKEVRRAAEAAARLGMAAAVRVLGVSSIAAQQFQRASTDVGYLSLTAATVEEADALLDGLPRKD